MNLQHPLSRRELLGQLGGGMGSVALATVLAQAGLAAPAPAGYDVLPKPPHHEPKARAVIQLFMHGGPSHVDLLDPKPMLSKYDGKPPPAEAADDEKITGNLLKSPFAFKKYGTSGLELSE